MNTISTPPSIEQYDEQQLDQSRIELLTAIRHLQERTELGQDQSRDLGAKKARFNQIADTINSLQAKTRLDPIDRLPPEIFTQIICSTAPSGSFHREWFEYNSFVLSLTLVSTRWMDFVINTPLFWTSILLDERVADCSSIAATFLQLSRQLPISVNIVWSSSLESSVIWLELQEHRNRITRVIYNFTYFIPYGMNQAPIELPKFLTMLSPLPLLDTLNYVGRDPAGRSVARHVLDVFPNITKISGFYLSTRSIRRLMSRHCSSIVLPLKVNPPFSLLEDNPALHTVSESMGVLPVSRQTEGISLLKKSVKWANLSLGPLNVSLSTTITEKMTQLVSLSVSGYLHSLIRFFINIDRLCRLRELSLGYLVGTRGMVEISNASFPSNGNVRFLSLCQSIPYGANEVKPLEKMFPGLILQSLSAVQSLSLKFQRLQNILSLKEVFDIKVLGLLPHLQHLTLQSELSIGLFELPPCETLNLIIPFRKGLNFSNQTCRQLHVIWGGYLGTDQSLDDHSLDDQAWPLLEKLTIPVNCIENSYMGFPHLGEISLKCGISQVELTGFCVSLALYPTFCPNLGALYMDQCPEWDIFFIMLERRLAWSINGSQPLRSIILPDHTPRSIIRYICDILQGRFPERPSNFDLSLFATLEVISDKTMYASIYLV
jgi:hypothetical protein